MLSTRLTIALYEIASLSRDSTDEKYEIANVFPWPGPITWTTPKIKAINIARIADFIFPSF